MLVFDLYKIGNRLYDIRRRAGLSRERVAEEAGISDRTYADIERGTVNMRIGTILRICDVLHITPDEILTEDDGDFSDTEEDLLKKLDACSAKEKETALRLLSVYLHSLPDFQ